MKTQSGLVGTALERLMFDNDELLMGFAIIASVGACIVTIMAVNEQGSGMLLLGWLPIAAFFGVRLLRGANRSALLRKRWVQARESGRENVDGPTPGA